MGAEDRLRPTEAQWELARKVQNPMWDSAIELRVLTFTHVAESFFGRFEKFNPNLISRLVAELYFPRLWKVYQEVNGAVKKSYFCEYTRAAAVLTDRNAVPTIFDASLDPAISKLLLKLDHVNEEGYRLLRGEQRDIFADKIYGVANYAMAFLDDLAKKREAKEPPPDNSDVISLIKDLLSDAEEFYVQSAQRSSQLYYFSGMIIGALLISVSGITLSTVLSFGPFLGSLIVGGLGAVVSVMSRISRGNLRIDSEAGTLHTVLVGCFRPIIGAVMAVAVYLSISGGLLPVTVPGDPSKALYFYSAVGFLAGFTERWAQDMLLARGGEIFQSPLTSSGTKPSKGKNDQSQETKPHHKTDMRPKTD